MDWSVLGEVIGGVGIFMLAISMLTQGLQMVSGNSMKRVLQHWTRSPGHGLVLGVVATAVLQSSTVTVATLIGLVNAAILQLHQAVWVVFGANVGTTLTTWLVSAVGFDFNIKAFALPIVGVGMLLKALARNPSHSAAGMAFAGIGLFFLGVDILKDAFSDYTANGDFTAIEHTGVLGIILFMLGGLVMTLITQSSSASLALILTSTAGGMLTIESAAAMIIGANLGTTSTAALAVIGAGANAKRTAAVHVLFNAITAVASLIALPLLLTLIRWLAQGMGMDGSPMVQLAIFHSGVKIFGILIIWPLVPWMIRFLENCFVSQAEQIGRPKYLDTYTLNMPATALEALVRELANQRDIIARMLLFYAGKAATREDERQAQHLRDGAESLSQEIREFVGQLTRQHSPKDTAHSLRLVLQVNGYLHNLIQLGDYIAAMSERLQKGDPNQPYLRASRIFFASVTRILEKVGTGENLYGNVLTDLRAEYSAAKNALLEGGVHSNMGVDEVAGLLDQIGVVHRVAKQLVKAERYLASLGRLYGVEAEVETGIMVQPALPFAT